MTTKTDLQAINDLNGKYVPSGQITLPEDTIRLVRRELELGQRTDVELMNVMNLVQILCAQGIVYPMPFDEITPEERSRLTASQLRRRKQELQEEREEQSVRYGGLLRVVASVIENEITQRKK